MVLIKIFYVTKWEGHIKCNQCTEALFFLALFVVLLYTWHWKIFFCEPTPTTILSLLIFPVMLMGALSKNNKSFLEYCLVLAIYVLWVWLLSYSKGMRDVVSELGNQQKVCSPLVVHDMRKCCGVGLGRPWTTACCLVQEEQGSLGGWHSDPWSG